MNFKNIYTSIACNRKPKSADWGPKGLLIFAASNAVALLDTNYSGSAKIISTFVEHKAEVNTVKWIKTSSREYQFVSGSDDCCAIVWNISNEENIKYCILEGHKNGITAVNAIEKDKTIIIGTASSDSRLKLWQVSKDLKENKCLQEINLINGYFFTIAFAILPVVDKILCAFSTDENKITFFLQNETKICDKPFHKVLDLVGHDDWIRDLDFHLCSNGDIFLASSSQDAFIRLWKIAIKQPKLSEISTRWNLINEEIRIEEKKFQIIINDNKIEFATTLESVLQGHENWVFSVHWNENEEGLRLLSCSMDKTMIIWSQNEDNIWMEKTRVGEVGGNLLGFYGGKFSYDGKAIFGHGYQGSFHMWQQDKTNKNNWIPMVIVGGHFEDVRDIMWQRDGDFLYSVSRDQTTRVHAPWIREGIAEITWHEIARPQVHGYDMQCIAVLSKYGYASAAEESIIRLFLAPLNFFNNLQRLCNINTEKERKHKYDGNISLIRSSNKLKSVRFLALPRGASQVSLGLSNRSFYEHDEISSEHHVLNTNPVIMNKPPPEETLMQDTLWPETEKLYKHGYDLFSLCSSIDSKWLVSSSKASSFNDAFITVWEPKVWIPKQTLRSHQLTVTQMKFSPNNQYLLSVSRDRCWTIFEIRNDEFILFAKSNKKNGIHTRIIWSCDWTHDSSKFATSSRDGKTVIWEKGELDENSSIKNWKARNILELKNESITAVAFAQHFFKSIEENYLMAIGLQNGQIFLYHVSSTLEKLFSFDKNNGHHSVVNKLQFRPNHFPIQLASCGQDKLIRIYEINF